MKYSDAHRRANAKYQKEKTKSILLRFFPAEMDVYRFASAKENTSGYIKGLIRSDMEKGDAEC